MDKKEVLEKLAFAEERYTISELVKFAEQGQYISILKHSRYYPVQVVIVRDCPVDMLEHFIVSRDSRIRIEVARRGYGLERLILDQNKGVLKAVAQYLRDLTQSGKSFKLIIED